MPKLFYQGRVYGCREGETVLDAFLRQGVDVPFSCKSGVCHVCIHQCVRGTVPTAAKRMLDPDQQAAGWFLPCRCRPVTDMEIVPSHATATAAPAGERIAAGGAVAHPHLWAALDEGARLNAILERFYGLAYNDSRLMGFFADVTRQRAIEKQYLFLRQLFTGEKVYFGDRPRNAHHWMVISDELFDHRQALLALAMREEGLGEEVVREWLALEEAFRGDIVKPAAWPKVVGGMELPLDGFGEMELEVGTACDGCGDAVEAGTVVRYHRRTGKTFCPACGELPTMAGGPHEDIRTAGQDGTV